MKTKTPLSTIVNLRLPNKLLFSILTFAGAVLAAASAIYPVNNGFEQPDLGSGPLSYSYGPIAPGWTFTPECCSGIAANGSDFNLAGATNGNNDNGATSTSGQAAFLQGGDGTLGATGSAWVSQTLMLPAGSYALNFSLEGRLAPGQPFNGAVGVDIFLNGVQVGGTLFPANLGSFNDVSVNLGNLTAGSYTIAFAGDDPIPGADRTTFVDNVRISVPDSGSTFLLMLCSGAALLIMRRFASVQLF
jgi:hypothetical protein